MFSYRGVAQHWHMQQTKRILHHTHNYEQGEQSNDVSHKLNYISKTANLWFQLGLACKYISKAKL